MFRAEISKINPNIEPSLRSVYEFNEFKPWLKSAKKRFKLSAGLNLKKIEYNFKWNQPYLSRGLNLSRGSNSLNSASGLPLGLQLDPMVLVGFDLTNERALCGK